MCVFIDLSHRLVDLLMLNPYLHSLLSARYPQITMFSLSLFTPNMFVTPFHLSLPCSLIFLCVEVSGYLSPWFRKLVRRLALSLMKYYIDHKKRPPGITTFNIIHLKWGNVLFISGSGSNVQVVHKTLPKCEGS